MDDEYLNAVRQPSERQIKYAESLGIDPEGKSFRVLTALIGDVLDIKAYKYVVEHEIEPGLRVRYIGDRDDMPKELTVSTVGQNGFLYFKKTHKYCRPWNVRPIR